MTRVFLALLLIAFGIAGVARGDDSLTLAMVCASESGFQTETHDCAAILSALRNRGERLGMPFASIARVYSRRVFDVTRSDRRAWLAHLNAAGDKPHGWPSHVSWPRHRPRWLALVEHAKELQSSPSAYPQVEHWAAPRRWITERALRAGWTIVPVHGAKNIFWRTR